MKYKRVPEAEDSFDENPCWNCIFGRKDGECHAPQEILDNDEECGYDPWNLPNYIYVEDNN